ncbi:uncharacterized protein [Phyllobates terribilis]|uniref:uncharacterized protein n=1 Tax=Phyllobates terribilis TaxID=111132 RepID=UPI003CCB0DEA
MEMRKRRRLLKPSLRTLFLSILSFILFLSHNSRVFRIIPTFSFSETNFISSSTTSRSSILLLRIQSRILLPNSLLVFLHKGGHSINHVLTTSHDIDCVYRHGQRLAFHPALTASDFDHFRWMLRCPLPPANYSSAVTLQWHNSPSRRRTRIPPAALEPPKWDWVAYAAEVDGRTAVVFVKGLNLRPDKDYDPRQFRCRFQSGKSSMLTTAISAAQEVVRCPLPDTLIINDKAVKVSIDRRRRQLLPSIARLYGNQLKTQNPNKHQLCACTMVWNQASALREWITYHAWLGVERWFVYDNNSDDGLGEEIDKLNSDNNYNITRHAWPWIKSQEAGFSHCVLRAKNQCSWVAFFDVDEFFYFPPPTKHHNNNDTASSTTIKKGGGLRELVAAAAAEIGEIRTKCHSFGPSGLTTRPRHGVTVGYTCRLQRPERHKSIVRPEAVDDNLMNAVHHFRLREGYVFQDTGEGTALINHYKYQVWDVFKSKFSRRVSTYVADWQDSQNEGSRDRAPGLGNDPVQPLDWKMWYCEVWDTGLRDFVLANFAHLNTGLLPWDT